MNELKSAHEEIKKFWEKDVISRSHGGDNFIYNYTDQWYSDRADLLVYVQKVRTENIADGAILKGTQKLHYNDMETDTDILVGVSTHRTQILFGDDEDNFLIGAGFADRLYGGAGDDTLKGNGGDDYMEGGDGNDTLEGGTGKNTLIGGAGNDTYIIEADGEPDTIIDSDGKGSIQLGNTLIAGTFKPPQGTTAPYSGYYSEDGQYRLTSIGDEWHLFVNSDNTHLAILQHWKDGDLDIHLGETDEPPPPPEEPGDDDEETELVYEMNFSNSAAMVNVNAANAPLGLWFTGSNRSNSITGSQHSDLIVTGPGSNYIMSGLGTILFI